MDAGSRKITLRFVEEHDLPLLLAWRQDREVMRYLPSAPKKPTWAMQWAWWVKRTPQRVDYMIILEGDFLVPSRPIGVVHYDNETHEVGIIIGEKASWSKGIAREALTQMLKLISPPWAWAAIHPENRASQVAFENVGFKKTGKEARNGQEEWRLG